MTLLIDAFLPQSIAGTDAAARAAEEAGYDGLLAAEAQRDPFLHLLRAALVTDRVALGSSVAIAFARSPMTLASSAFDLAEHSQGRFVLGLGSQVKGHIERRFSMPWSHPAARMREMVMALRAIWSCWQDGEKLDFRGDFYTHTLMTPFFSPEPHQWGPPPVYLAGVGPLMTEVAGETCDGLFFHPLTTRRYISEVTLPALEAGRAKAGKGMEGFAISGPAFAAVGRDDRELATAVAGTKKQLAFYCSTPAYRSVLDVHGWGDLQPELTRLSKEGAWDEMGRLIDDDMLDAFAVTGGPAEAGKALRSRWDGVATRISLYAPYEHDPAIWPEVVDALRS